ncbi:unnamed protein product, partial [Toxocara canis]|uniref:CAP-Gly domain-containing linker protein 1 n=1 Tax=Toxocara canis TaxID=6265 RepID=A0A183UKF6_TOXCA
RESIISAVSRVGDWEIGDRCQIGTRVGNIVFIGPTRFAPGEWIGVVLDEPLGKNDGSVEGQRYFQTTWKTIEDSEEKFYVRLDMKIELVDVLLEADYDAGQRCFIDDVRPLSVKIISGNGLQCEPNHGLFCKASKLERVVTSPMSNAAASDALSPNPFAAQFGFDVGDRVVVPGGKLGTLRFLGNTEFKEGVWAGIELDQPLGKNDGSVQGKRYFTCKAPYGLFAMASKVVRSSLQTPSKIKIRHTRWSALQRKSGSQESLTSVGASSVASSRISRFNSTRPIQRPIVLSSSQGQNELINTLQESLKERDKHLEQMIKERDIERNEMARLTSRCEEAESRLAQMQTLSASSTNTSIAALTAEITDLKKKIREEEEVKTELKIKLSEVEEVEFLTYPSCGKVIKQLSDLTFRYDEETILNAELKEKLDEVEKKSGGSGGTPEVERLAEQLAAVQKSSEEAQSKFAEEKRSLQGQCDVKNALIGRISDLTTRLKSLQSEFDGMVAQLSKAGQEESRLTELINKSKEDSKNSETIIESSRKKIEDLLAKVESANTSLEESLAEIRESRDGLEAKVKEISVHNEQLLSEMEENKRSLKNSMLEVDRKEQEVQSLSAKINELMQQTSRLEDENVKMRDAKSNLETSKSELEEKLNGITLQNEKLRAQVEEGTRSLENNMTNVTRKEEELQSLSAKFDELTQQMSRLENENAELRGARTMLETSKRDLEEKMKEMTEKGAGILAQLEESQKAMESNVKVERERSEELRLSNDRLQKLREQLSSAEAERKALEEKISALGTGKAAVEVELTNALSKVTLLESTVSKLTASDAKWSEENETSRRIIVEKDEQLAQLQSHIAELTDKNVALDNETKALKESRSGSAQLLDETRAQVKELSEKIKILEEEKSTLIVKAKSNEDELKSATATISQLSENMNRVQAKNGELEASLLAMETAKKEVEAKLSETIALHVDLYAKISDCEVERDTLAEAKKQRELDLKNAEAKNAQLSEQIQKLEESLCESSSADEMLKKEVEMLREEYSRITETNAARIEVLSTAKETVLKELSAAKNEANAMRSTYSVLESSLQTCRGFIEFDEDTFSAKADLEKTNDELGNVRKEASAALSRVSQLEEEKKKLSSELEECQNKAKEQEISLKDAHQEEITRIEQKQAEMKETICVLEADKQKALADKEGLQKEVTLFCRSTLLLVSAF